jgi:hypothetical protein
LVVTWNIRSEDEDQFKGVEFAFFQVDDYGDKYVLVLGTQVRPKQAPAPPPPRATAVPPICNKLHLPPER